MIALLLMPVLSTGVFDCEVTTVDVESATVMCEDATLMKIPLTEWRTFAAWKQPPVEGLRLKAARDDEGSLHAVTDCETRTREAIEAYCGGLYCRPPINSLIPEDCH